MSNSQIWQEKQRQLNILPGFYREKLALLKAEPVHYAMDPDRRPDFGVDSDDESWMRREPWFIVSSLSFGLS